MTEAPPSLAAVRDGIDAIDQEIVRLLATRAKLVRVAAAHKADDQAVRAPERVEQVVARVRGLAADAGLDPEVAEATWRAMIDRFVDLELRARRDLQR
jgi:isochorismate pyruvate lyase